ncbi:hypothetical protein GWI33_001024 [Rhynchophorus ferrugineus]|uniref:Uncharacterized protein n=1 Tax=Rhynchophorus ferrugineus TaxID=354439 RepID=A0A834ILK1_RHYFE|nr:hypothetical protein GWI33_001024 [Rhynchophorus ferrugineus]
MLKVTRTTGSWRRFGADEDDRLSLAEGARVERFGDGPRRRRGRRGVEGRKFPVIERFGRRDGFGGCTVSTPC